MKNDTARAIALAAAIAAFFPAAGRSQDGTLQTQAGPVRMQIVARGIEHPWALAFLPRGGGMLVTEKQGRLRLVGRDGRIMPPIAGVPQVLLQGQVGLLDVALDPGFASNRMVYLSYAEAGDGAGTAVARGRLNAPGTALENVSVIFRQQPKVSGSNHFGSRLAFARDGTLFIALGERNTFARAQELWNHLGKIVRIKPDGSVPPGNPFLRTAGALPEIWSYGHRNIQGAAIHPQTGVLWIHEMGPAGGDEINIPVAGGNYGWPLVSWGRHYGGQEIPNPPTRPDLADAIYHWTPSIAPSGMAFYTGKLIPAWRGNLLVGALAGRALVRLTLSGTRVTGEERIGFEARIRDVREGPDGAVYLLTDERDGKILRLAR